MFLNKSHYVESEIFAKAQFSNFRNSNLFIHVFIKKNQQNNILKNFENSRKIETPRINMISF